MGDNKTVNIFYSLENEGNILNKFNSDIFKVYNHIFKKDKIIKFIKYYNFCFDMYNVNFISFNDINYFTKTNLFNNSFVNIIICNIKEKENYIKEFSNLNKIIFIENKYIKTRKDMNIIILLKEILFFYFNNYNKHPDLKDMYVYVSELYNKENSGIGVYNTLKECSKLYNQRKVKINIISGSELNMESLYYIFDPLLEYTNENSKVRFENIIQSNMKDNFIINILGAE